MKKKSMEYLLNKTTKRMRILGVAVLSVFAVIIAVYYVSVVSPSRVLAFSGIGEGNYDNPYQITNCTQLQQVQINPGAQYALVSDVDCSDTTNWNNGSGFAPLSSFTGIFDGRNYAIKNLYINKSTTSAVGLFGELAGGGVIKNFSLTKDAQYKDRVDISGGADVGALAGVLRLRGVSNVHSALNVIGYGMADKQLHLGGLVGFSIGGNISTSSSSGNVLANEYLQGVTDTSIGGLIGLMYTTTDGSATSALVQNSYATGNISFSNTNRLPAIKCGGFVGFMNTSGSNQDAVVENSYTTSNVACTMPTGSGTVNPPSVGGFVGAITASSSDAPPRISNSFATGLVTANTNAGYGFYGFVNVSWQTNQGVDLSTDRYDATKTGKTACGNDNRATCPAVNQDGQSPDYFSQTDVDGFLSGWDQGIWQFGPSYPTLKTVTVRPDGPSNLDVTRDGNDFVVTWVAPLPENGRSVNLTTYELFYADANSGNGDNYQKYGDSISGTATTQRVTGLTIPGKYNFRIRVHAQAQDVEPGLFSSVKPFATGMPATAPANFVVTPRAKSAVLKWDSVDGATSYDVEYKKAGTETWVAALGGVVADGSGKTSTAYELDPQVSYDFRVTGKNAAGQGPWTDTATVATTAPTDHTISTCQQLQDVDKDLEGVYKLTANINCANFVGFHPIGNNDIPFRGTFDGNGKTISNLNIYQTIQPDSDQIKGVGLFAVLYNATVKSLIIKDSTIVADYTLSTEVDADQNGVPDAPVVVPPSISLPTDGSASATDIQNELLGVVGDTADQASQAAQSVPSIASQFAKVSAGGLAGTLIGAGSYTNISVLNTTVRGGVVGGMFGAVMPISRFSDIFSSDTANNYPPMILDGLQTSGLVVGNMAGGLIGAASSSLSGLVGSPGSLTIQNSSSSSEVQANVAGGMVGLTASLSFGYVTFFAISTDGSGIFQNQDFLDALMKSVSTQDVIIKNSHATGLVSACDAPTDIRLGALGGLVGLGVGTSIESSYSSSKITTCSNTASNWGLYGGFMGGLGGVMLASRVTDSYASGNVEAIENSSLEQYSPGIFMGATGGLVGLNVTLAEDTDGRYAIKNSHSSGESIISGKQGLLAVSGGLTGIYLGNGTIKDSYSTGRIVHVSPQQNLFSLSVAGGLSGLTVGVDVPTALSYSWNFPEMPTTVGHGIDIDNSYATGDVIVQKNANGGSLAVNGGLEGVFLGGGTISNSHATGNILNNLPNDVRIRVQERSGDSPSSGNGDSAILGEVMKAFQSLSLQFGDSKYGATVSGGLIGSAYGVDTLGIGSIVGAGVSSDGKNEATYTTRGLIIDNSYETGSVQGNLAGGLLGSADFNIKINKAYADGNVEGAIVGGLVGQSGLLTTVAEGVAGFIANLLANDIQKSVSRGGPDNSPYAMRLFDTMIKTLGTLDITNAYASGKLTGKPGLAVLQGHATVLGQPVEEIPAPGVLPTTVGGLIGVSMSPARSITNAYASGDITVEADPAYNPDPSWKIKLPKIPSFAGGIIGIDIAVPQVKISKLMSDIYAPEGSPTIAPAGEYQMDIPKMENVFSAAKISLSSSTLTGGADGAFIAPLKFVDALFMYNDPEELPIEKTSTFKNVYIDKTRISVDGCGGPKETWSEIADGLMSKLFIPGEDGKNTIPTEDMRDDINNHLAPIVNPLFVKPACQYVNADNKDPRYFIQNKVNTPMNQWNFDNVWVVKKNDYPKFVAAAETTTPNTPLTVTPPPVTPIASAAPRDTAVTKALNQLLQPTPRKPFDAGKYNWFQTLLRSIPPLLAKSIPYLIILVILSLAARYARQALAQYRQLQKYHKSILRLLATKAAIDDYLAITTHYLNTPVAIMGGAVELLQSLKKIPDSLGKTLGAKIKSFADEASKLQVANQVSGAESANTTKPVQRQKPNPFKEKAVWMPSVIALSLLLVANVLFMYADVYTRSWIRIAIELGCMALAIGLLALAHQYRTYIEQNKETVKKQLEEESAFYEKRQSFISHASIVTHDNHLMLELASNGLKKLPESKLFFNGLGMLGGVATSLANLKKFSKVDNEPALLDVSSYVRNAVKDAETAAKEKNITVTSQIDNGILTHIPAAEMRQLVSSLLDNAVKFGKENGKVQLAVKRSRGKIYVTVADNGIGISKEKLPSLLKPFTRGTDSMQYNYEGVGLSLYTNKVVLDKIGGKIKIESRLGKGTVTTIEIPAHRNAKTMVPLLLPAHA